jgi:hypothetical protein
MGHYASEMMCDKCGNVRCTCPVEKSKPQKGWYITPDFRVITVEEADAEFTATFGPRALFSFRKTRKLHRTREEAEIVAREACEVAVEMHRVKLNEMKHLLKTVRPWEKK